MWSHPRASIDQLAGKAVPPTLDSGAKRCTQRIIVVWGQGQAALRHDLHQIPGAQLVAQVRADTQDDDLGFKVTASEQLSRPFPDLAI